ncbi:MAG: TetR/AcrR family transcriptional regulator [Bacteriovoracia bacterium]
MEEKITEKQKLIFEAAIEVFAEKGFSAASTSEIAKRAGVAEGTVFKRFSTKKELLLGIGLFIASKISIPSQVRELETVLSADYDQFEDLLKALLKNRLAFVKKNRKLLKIVLQELPFHPELGSVLKDAIREKVIPLAVSIVKKYQKTGVLRNIPPTTVLRMIASQFLSYVILRNFIAVEKNWDDEKEIEFIVKVLMHGLSAN